MPQFDTFSFLSQLFWLFASFSSVLVSLNYYVLPMISATLKVRNSILSPLSTQQQPKNVSCFQSLSYRPAIFEKISEPAFSFCTNNRYFISVDLLQITTLSLFLLNIFHDIFLSTFACNFYKSVLSQFGKALPRGVRTALLARKVAGTPKWDKPHYCEPVRPDDDFEKHSDYDDQLFKYFLVSIIISYFKQHN